MTETEHENKHLYLLSGFVASSVYDTTVLNKG